MTYPCATNQPRTQSSIPKGGGKERGTACLDQSVPTDFNCQLSSAHSELDGLRRLAHVAQGPLLDHQRHDLVQGVGGSHGGQLGVGVVCWSDFDDVGGDEVDALQAADDSAQLARGPAAGLGGAGCGSDCACMSVFVGHEVIR
jgi:hypothetical protein